MLSSFFCRTIQYYLYDNLCVRMIIYITFHLLCSRLCFSIVCKNQLYVGVDNLLLCGKHLQYQNHFNKIWGLGPYDHFNSTGFYWSFCTNQGTERSCICVLRSPILSLFLDFGNCDSDALFFVFALFSSFYIW
jgi:hypothetical protein